MSSNNSQADSDALALLQDANLLGRIERILSGDSATSNIGIIREKRNKLYAFLVFLSSRPSKTQEVMVNKKPTLSQLQTMAQMLQVRGTSRSGKTHLCKHIGKFFEMQEIGDWSAKALNYMNLVDKDILYFQELKTGDKEDNSLRLISGEDGGFTAMTNEPNESGSWSPVERKIHPIVFVTTTTRMKVDEQLTNRSHIINIDESNEQTMAIIKAKEQKAEQKLFKYALGNQDNLSEDLLKSAIKQLERHCDVIATCQKIVGKLIPKTTNVRLRSDYGKISTILELVVFLHQHQRPYVETIVPIIGVDGKPTRATFKKKLLFMMPQDVYLTIELVSEGILSMFTNLEGRQREILPFFEELRKCKVTDVRQGGEIEGFTINKARTLFAQAGIPLARKTIETRLFALEAVGMIEVYKTGRENTFKIVAEPSDIKALLNVSKPFENSSELIDQAIAESKEFCKRAANVLGVKMPSEDAFVVSPAPNWFINDHDVYEPIMHVYKAENLGRVGKSASEFMKLGKPYKPVGDSF